jgi:hypothetical protein
VTTTNDRLIEQSRTPKDVLNGNATMVGALNPATPLHLVFGLTPPKMAEEEKFLQSLQDHSSPNFHKYLTPEQWNARFAPSTQDEQAVVDWAQSNGMSVTQRFKNRLLVTVDATADVAAKAFSIKMNSYELGGRTEFSNDRDPVIPAQLAGIVHSVMGLNSIQRLQTPRGGSQDPRNSVYTPGPGVPSATMHADGNKTALQEAMKAAKAAKARGSLEKKELAEFGAQAPPPVTNGYIDPTDIYSSYGYDYTALQSQGHCCNPTNDSGGSTPTTSIAVATSGALNGDDIAGFQSRYYYLAYLYNYIGVGGTYTCNNSSSLDDSCVETTLDTEWAIATANSFGSYLQTSHVWVYLAADNHLSTFTTMFNSILSDGHARVMTTSWGCAEFDCYDSSTMDTDHAIFNSMLGQGWTLLGSSGDSGSVTGCGTTNRVTYPASDPDLVAVGGTSLSLYSDGSFYSETGWQGGTYAGACATNNGGSGGGCSTKFAAPGYQTNPFCGSTGRSVPDISLNAGYGQNVYYNGGWHGYGGTSIATPMAAGFTAQADSYLLALGLGGAPIGSLNYPIYYFAHNPSYAQHYPYYDGIGGCNNNDVTAAHGLDYYCAVSGYDRVTGWGSFNALQFSWAINAYFLGDFAAPTVHFSGPAGVNPSSNTWFNTDQTVSWTVTDAGNGLTPTGVAGFSQAWDSGFTDPTSEASQGVGNSFYSGPQFPNATSGYLQLSWAGQGCHYATVDAWDNSGITSGNNYFYWICYDTVAPVTTGSLAGTLQGGKYTTHVVVGLHPTDATSGVASTLYQLDGGAVTTFTAPFTVSALGTHHVVFHSQDVAGNVETSKTRTFTIAATTTAALTSSLNPSTYGKNITFKAKVTGSSGATPTGTVTFMNGTTALGTSSLSATGVASLTKGSLPGGSNSITAIYNGSNTDLTSTSAALIQKVNKAGSTTTLASSVNPSSYHQAVKFTATVKSATTGIPAGNVTFKNGATTLGSAALNAGGIATFTTQALTVGAHVITAVYAGNGNFAVSTSANLTQTVKKATTTSALVSSLNPSKIGQAVTFTATITGAFGGNPGGTVTFKSGSTVLGTGAVNTTTRKATFSTSTLTVGAHLISAQYGGNANFSSSAAPAIAQNVNKSASKTTLTSSQNPSTHGTTVTFTANVTSTTGPTPTGTVTFKNGTTNLGTGTLNGSGAAVFHTSALAVGTHSITAVYAGNNNDTTSTSPALSQKVN